MKIITTKSGVEIKIFSSAKEMSIGRYSDFQKYLTTPDLQTSLLRIKAFNQEGKAEDIDIEVNNAIEALLNLQSGIGVYTLPFACIVAEISGKVANDTTIDGLNTIVEQLKALDITQYDIEMSVEELKKK